MPDDKAVKKDFVKKASADPDKYYATSVLKEEGFARNKCSNCARFFWSVLPDARVCGDPACSGGFRFFDGTPAREELDYVSVWKRFSSHFKKLGYEPIKRYPVAARWRDDTDFVQASIYDFQPYVVSGEVAPPANPLVVPQFCLRFNDIDNVGITGAHYTGFVMIGQHAFVPKEDWDQARYFRDIHSWLSDGLGLPNDEITYHEDAWAGGGNFGPCMEYFSRGLELGNQVYMQYEMTSAGPAELPLKVLDMGMGHERNAWFTGGKSTSYETTFPTVCDKMREISGLKQDVDLVRRFLPYSSYLNIDEIEDVDKEWSRIAKALQVGKTELKETIIPLSAMYSIGEHARSLLVAISDGVLPSNVAGGYNLRVILRRALAFIEKYGWSVELADVCRWHAQYLKDFYPELRENLDDVTKILEVEKKKYRETRKRSAKLLDSLLASNARISENKLVELYDSNGINPTMVRDEAAKRSIDVRIPDNFYALLAERHEQKVQKTASKRIEKLPLEDLPPTTTLFYDDYERTDSDSLVLKIIGKDVILDKTVFFATSGGQIHDTGTLNDMEVIDVFRQGKHIVHVMKDEPDFSQGHTVHGKIDFARRKQLSQHHTVTHIYNAVMRKCLGGHAWQCGTAKLLDKARLDMTHFDSLSSDQIAQFQKMANEIVKKGLEVKSRFESRTDAEQKYGFGIYQGGVVPGKDIRIVEIDGFDVEACGGTHVHRTDEIEHTRILKASKIQDGVVRLEYSAGAADIAGIGRNEEMLTKIAKLLDCDVNQTPGRAKELFDMWKSVVKKKKKVTAVLSSTEKYDGDVLSKLSETLRTQPEFVLKTIKRFKDEIAVSSKNQNL